MNRLKKWMVPLALTIFPLAVLAVNIPGSNVIPPEGSEFTLDKIQAIIERVATWLIVVGVLIAVIYIIWGGIMWITARGDQTKYETAKKAMKHGIVGTAIVLGVGVIIRTIAAVVLRTFFGAGQ
jgi:hypothetical protein